MEPEKKIEKNINESSVSAELQKKIDNVVGEIAALADKIPGATIIHKLPDLSVLFISKTGLDLLGVTWSDVKAMNYEQFQKNFFNEDDAKDYTSKILSLFEQDTDNFVTYFQQVRTSRIQAWDWYMSATKMLLRDDDGKPLLLITVALQIDPRHYFTAKAARLLEENEFLKKNYHQFSKLTAREQEVLKQLALGKSAAEIGEVLNISVATAETHRKKIYLKLNTNNSYILSQYARAFDLI